MDTGRNNSCGSQSGRYEIFLDGTCSFCCWMQEQIEPYDTNRQLQFVDYNVPAVAAQTPYTRSELSSEIHLRTPEGRWLMGFDACLAILQTLPTLSWISWIARIRPLYWLGPTVYQFVAHHRHVLPGVPVGCATGTCTSGMRRHA
jgi:predicted DCC family thiol-disulfide oxidoreductase YuxK